LAISIYYSARRKTLLTPSESSVVKAIASRYSVDAQIERLIATGVGLNWESFSYAVNSAPGGLFKKATIFTGSTKLPDNQEDASWTGVQHWAKCLSEIRAAVPGSDWHVAVEDHELHWDSRANAYDPSR
jgi:hypothetical protein